MGLFSKKQFQTITKEAPTFSAYDNPYVEELSDHYKARLLNETNLDRLTSMKPEEMRQAIERIITQFMSEEKVVIAHRDKEHLLTRIIDESVGFGPLEPLLNDLDITEILINGHGEVYIEKKGQLTQTNLKFRDERHVRHIIDRVVAPIGRRIDESSPMVDARLPDGSRVNAVIPPISLNGTLVSIRKFSKDPFTMNNLIEFNSMDEAMSSYLQSIVAAKMNVLISGGTGSGKTTLLNALSRSIPPGERVITIEDSAELKLDRPNVVGLEARPPNTEGKGAITIRDLVRNALRMRPDRIVVGEVRGAEAFDMLQAMNTGHEGSLTTVHANTPLDAVRRLEGMIMMAGMELPSSIIREYIVGALDYIVQIERLQDGQRKTMSISEVVVDTKTKGVKLQEIFKYQRTGLGKDGKVQGFFTPTGIIPKNQYRLQVFGQDVPDSLFEAGEGVNTDDSISLI
ncbi:pilus assembly protein CpaF [Gracilibacillus ureilyticus]|uniref:Pilus assembly protein CpaF n=1 Tax=Gracilibacillus ureilyticus TaxID=531814 RepID=A0A1H9VIL9_9BACI|nr:CpaF family protein [Gracilibacillus ureilyticus]SES21616.1 pilus assembly protein CpaF [Gracilibacillus ureilyticus]